MVKKYIIILSVMLLCVFALNGCNNNNYINISDTLITTLKCVKAEDFYKTQTYEIPQELINKYEVPQAFDGENIYFLIGSQYSNFESYIDATKSTSYIIMYNLESQTESVIFSETINPPENTEINIMNIDYLFAGIYNSCIYYYRCESYGNNKNMKFMKLSMSSLENECIFDFSGENSLFPEPPVEFENKLYFFDLTNIDWSVRSYYSTIYCYDMGKSEILVFAENAEFPLVKDDEIIFYQDGAYRNKNEILFYPNKENEMDVSGVYSTGKDIFYSYYNVADDTAVSSTMGIYADNYERKDIASTNDDSAMYIYKFNSCKSYITFQGTKKPVFFDISKNTFAMLNNDRDEYWVLASTNNDGIMFLGYDYDENYENTIVHIVK